MVGMDALRMMHEIAKGMKYLHCNNILHGDLKVRINLFDYPMPGALKTNAGCERTRGRQRALYYLRFRTERA
jgi:hypothetical protein